jgi:hypothetical protein
MVLAVVLDASAVLPAEAKDMVGQTELRAIVVDRDGLVGFLGFVAHLRKTEPKLAEGHEAFMEMVVGSMGTAAARGRVCLVARVR